MPLFVSMLTEINGDEILKASTEKGSIKDSFGDIFAKAGLKTKTNGDKNDNKIQIQAVVNVVATEALRVNATQAIPSP